MGYTSVRKCILIEIRTKFNLYMKRNELGRPYLIFAIDMMSLGRHTTSGRADITRKESKGYQIFLEDLMISNTRR